MTKKKILITLLVILSTGFIFYIQKYQQLINEGSALLDERCIKINPLIIQKKSKYLEGIGYLKAGDRNKYVKSLDEYKLINAHFIEENEKFLPKFQDYLNRKDFQWLIDKHSLKLTSSQFEFFAADYRGALALSNMLEKDTTKNSEELLDKFIEEEKRSEDFKDEYYKIWEEKQPFSIRYNFTYIPESKCPRDNWDIPNTDNPFAPQVPDLPFST